MFASGDLHGSNRLGYCEVAEHIIGMRGFLKPKEIQVTGGFAKGDGLFNGPLLVGIDHEAHGVACSLPH